MAHAHIARLNERIAEARAQGMTGQEVINILADVAKSSPQGMKNLLAARDDAIRKNRSDVGAAIETLLFNTPGGFQAPNLHDQVRAVEKSADAEPDLHDAIKKALTPSTRQSHGDATPLIGMAHERQTKERTKPVKKDDRSKTRRDIEHGSVPRRTPR